jgi:hypothetical protein
MATATNLRILRTISSGMTLYRKLRYLTSFVLLLSLAGKGWSYAWDPDPADGAIYEDTWVSLVWQAGDHAVSFDIYFGENYDDVRDGTGDAFQANESSTFFVVGFPGFAYPDGLVPGTTYYWRIDEVNDLHPDSPWIGDVWSFMVPPMTAYAPEPADGAEFVDPNVTLSWQPGLRAVSHTVYFSAILDYVNYATGGISQETATYTPDLLELGETYYWRIDEFDGITTHKGDVWRFTVGAGAPTETGGRIIYVDDDANGVNDGSNWADAYIFLQDALTAARTIQKPVEIRVAQGIYKPDQEVIQRHGDRSAAFQLINGVAIKGGYAGLGEPEPDARDVDLYKTILSGDLNGDDELYFINNLENSYHVVVGSGTDETAVLDGFTITAGNADLILGSQGGGGMRNEYCSPKLANLTFSSNTTQPRWGGSGGGGMYNADSSPIMNNCDFTENITNASGGGMYNERSNPRLVGCTFSYNYSEGGGGMYNLDSSPVLDNCAFIGNVVDRSGGGILNERSSPRLNECTFIYNWSEAGAGISNYVDSSPTLNNCKFSGNLAILIGGGVQITKSSATLTDCIFLENTASSGGGIVNGSSDSEIVSCTFVNNRVRSNGGGIASSGSDSKLVLTNCIITNNVAGVVDGTWGAGGGLFNSDGSNLKLTNCIITSNHSTGSGGGFSNERDAALILINCIIGSNKAAIDDALYIGGGGIYNINGESISLINCLITGNTAKNGSGGGFYNSNWNWTNWSTLTNCTLMNCTFVGNSAENGDSIACDSRKQEIPGTLQLTNCILWNSSDEIWNNDNSTITVTFSDVYGGWPGEGNIDTNPLFVDADGEDNIFGTDDDDLRLSPDSLCIDTGDNSAIPQSIVADLDGNPRIVNETVDMGAYEFRLPPTSELHYLGQVTASGDDGYAFKETFQNLDTDFLKIGSSPFAKPPYYYVSGMVFRNVDIPRGAEITSARLKICAYTYQLTDITFGKIEAESADNAAAFGISRNIAALPTTSTSVQWNIIELWAADTWYESPDIADVIQEVIDRDGWSANNSLAIIYSGRSEGGYRNFSSYDRGSDYAPKLEITYIP